MKKLFILSAAGLMIAASVNAQANTISSNTDMATLNRNQSATRHAKKELRKLKGSEVSYQSKQEFYKDFGDLPVSKWERTINFDKATFINNGQTTTAYYDMESKLVGTVSPKTFADLPENAQKYIHEKYGAYTPKSVIFFDDNEVNESDMILFGTQFNDEDNYFIELQKDNKKIILQVTINGDVQYFSDLK